MQIVAILRHVLALVTAFLLINLRVLCAQGTDVTQFWAAFYGEYSELKRSPTR